MLGNRPLHKASAAYFDKLSTSFAGLPVFCFLIDGLNIHIIVNVCAAHRAFKPASDEEGTNVWKAQGDG